MIGIVQAEAILNFQYMASAMCVGEMVRILACNQIISDAIAEAPSYASPLNFKILLIMLFSLGFVK